MLNLNSHFYPRKDSWYHGTYVYVLADIRTRMYCAEIDNGFLGGLGL